MEEGAGEYQEKGIEGKVGVPRRGGLWGGRGRSEELLRHDLRLLGSWREMGTRISPGTREVDMGLRLTFFFLLICIDHVGWRLVGGAESFRVSCGIPLILS